MTIQRRRALAAEAVLDAQIAALNRLRLPDLRSAREAVQRLIAAEERTRKAAREKTLETAHAPELLELALA